VLGGSLPDPAQGLYLIPRNRVGGNPRLQRVLPPDNYQSRQLSAASIRNGCRESESLPTG
jgi:hypothetical protein